MEQLRNPLWWNASCTRAIKTMAQTFLSTVGTSAVIIGDVDWRVVASASVLSAILSFATSLAGLPEVEE